MRVVVEQLQGHLSQKLSVTEITKALEAAGVEVEEVIHPPEFDPRIVTALVRKVKPHPDADRLWLAEVESSGEVYEVVCGAANLKPDQRVALAIVGAKLPDGTEIKAARIRGQESQGMICSEKELGLGSDHDGILDLGTEVPLDVPLTEVFGPEQSVIDIVTAANRWDLQSYRGLAAEVAAHTGAEAVFEKITASKTKAKKVDSLFKNQVKEEVAAYGLVKLRLKSALPPSPVWMQRHLRLQGVKPVNSVVDITNYVMLETGQPLHAFDAGSIKGLISVRFAANQEKITTLDGISRTLSTSDLVIADDETPVALAGVMGSSDTQIHQDTKEILLEAAAFEAALVRKTAKRHNLRTEASSRFERGLPVQALRQALVCAVELLVEHADAEALSYQNELNVWPWVQHIGVKTGKFNQLTGLGLEGGDIAANLRKLNFDAEVFDIATEARKHLGKPYKLGAKFRTDGVDAFDCSYLVDYLYSLIGVHVGHTALGQYEIGTPVETEELRPGDAVFYEGQTEDAATDHYYKLQADGSHARQDLKEPKKVGHVGLYVGNNKVVMAAKYRYQDGEWLSRDDDGVVEVELSEFTANPGFLGCRRFVEGLDDYVRVTVPWWRPDVKLTEDVVEEVIKLAGLESVPSTLPDWSPGEVHADEQWTRISQIRWLLYGLGLFEVTTYPFISEEDITTFNLKDNHLKLANPRSKEQAYLRSSLMPLLVRSTANNLSRRPDFGLFEIARVFEASVSESELPREHLKLGLVVKSKEILELKNYLDQVLAQTGIEPVVATRSDLNCLHPARQAELRLGDKSLGWFGEVHPDILAELKIKSRLSYAEIDVSALILLWSRTRFTPLPKYQSSYRDLTLKAPVNLTWQDLKKTLGELKDIRFAFVDEYLLSDNHKAVTVHLELLALEATLSDNEINTRLAEAKRLLQERHGVEIEL